MRELEHRFGDAVAIVGVHSGKFTTERITARIRDASIRLGATHPILNDRQFRVWRAYAVRAWPTLVAIDPSGYVIGMSAGEFTADAVSPFVERVLGAARADGTLHVEPLDGEPEPPAIAAGELAFPGKVALRGGRIAIADTGHHRVLVGRLADDGRSMHLERVVGTGIAGFDDGNTPSFHSPQGLALTDDTLFVADAGNHAIRAIALDTGAARTIAGTGAQLHTMRDRAAGALSSPWDLALAGHTLHVAMAGIHQVWSVDVRDGAAAPWAGSGAEELHDGPPLEAALAQPMGLALAGDRLLVADAESSAIRTIGLAPGEHVRTVVGTGLFDFGDVDGTGDRARLQHPQGLAVASDGRVLVCDSYNDSLRWLDLAERRITTWVRGLHEPGGVALGEHAAFVADTNAHRILVVDLASGSPRPLEIRG